MNAALLKQALRNNRGLLVVLIGVLAVLAYSFATRNAAPPDAPSSHGGVPGEPSSAQQALPQPVEPRAPPEEQSLAVIAEHRERFEADPTGEDAPVLLAAMGNLYRQKLGDYDQAAQCFERLIDDFPDFPGVGDAYLQLEVCYEQLGDLESRAQVYRRMLAAFPEDSQEYKYAASKLWR